jgi:hypothetical protein
VLAFGRGSDGSMVTAAVIAVVAAGLAGYNIIHISRATANVTLFGHHLASTGWGLYVTFGGALATLIALVSDSSPGIRGLTAVVAIAGAIAVLAAGPLVGSFTAIAPTVGATSPSTVPSTSPAQASGTTVPTISTPTSTSSTYSAPGTAPTNTTPSAGSQKCDANITAGPDTSCPFAENVSRAVAAGYQRTGQIPTQVTSSSPVTGKSYQLSCVSATIISCTTASGASATFSVHSVQVY